MDNDGDPVKYRKNKKQSKFIRAFKHRSQALQLMLSKRQSIEELKEKGIWDHETVFGRPLKHLPIEMTTGLPEFVIICARKIEASKGAQGLYRINGDAASVQRLRLAVNQDDYQQLDISKDIHLLTSLFKLFFRELPEPLISSEMRSKMSQVVESHEEEGKKGQRLWSIVTSTGEMEKEVLCFLFHHLFQVAMEPANMMDFRNLATVFGPTLLHSSAADDTKRPESMFSEMEQNNVMVELLIKHVNGLE